MSMREVTVPELVSVPSMDTNGEARPHPFADFVVRGLLTDMRFGAGYDAVAMLIELGKAFDGCAPGQKVRIRPPAWELLCKIIEHPQFPGGGGFHPWSARFLLCYMDAIKEAAKIEGSKE